MGTILRPLDFGSMGTETTALIQCINGRELQINNLWCPGLDVIFLGVHHTARVEVQAETVLEFVTNYLDKNGRQIKIIGKFSVNESVQFWGIF